MSAEICFIIELLFEKEKRNFVMRFKLKQFYEIDAL